MIENKFSTNKDFSKAVVNVIGRTLGYEVTFKPVSSEEDFVKKDYIKSKKGQEFIK